MQEESSYCNVNDINACYIVPDLELTFAFTILAGGVIMGSAHLLIAVLVCCGAYRFRQLVVYYALTRCSYIKATGILTVLLLGWLLGTFLPTLLDVPDTSIDAFT